MPVYNGENYIVEAIESILSQSFSNFELIICDNTSTDRTEAICREYAAKDARIRYYRNDVNLGAAANYNRVFELSSGKYFKWATHDDMLASKFVEHCVDILESYPEVVLCYPRTILIDETGKTFGRYDDNLNLRDPQAHKRYRKFFAAQGLCNPVFGVIRREALAQTPLIGDYYSSDRVLLGELALHGKFFELPEHLFLRRIHLETSLTVNKTDNEITAWYNPNKRNKMIFPRWRRLVEYIKAIGRVPISNYERLLCYFHLGMFVLVPKRWFGLGSDILKAIKSILDFDKGYSPKSGRKS